MSERFELFRLSLLARDQFDMFDEETYTRADWLRKVFGDEVPFSHYGTDFHFSPSSEASDNEILIGRIGRHVIREENKPPTEGLEDVTRDAWVAALMVLDPTEHDDGQKLAVQHVNEVGSPTSLVKALVDAINVTRKGPYQIEPSQIVESQSFWDYVENNRGLITSVSFDFIAPNMLGADDEFKDEMREFRDSEKARRVKLTIQNEDGVNPETGRVKRAVNYALSESRGKVTARAKGRASYNSMKEKKIVSVDGIAQKGAELVGAARDLAARILGRE